jgi:phytanoyl-CoA hydroxylase
MRFTKEERQSWIARGYIVAPSIFPVAEIDEIGAAFLSTLERLSAEQRVENVRAGNAPKAESQVLQMRAAHLQNPRFDRLARDSRLLDAVESLIGPNIRLVHFQGLYKPPHTGGPIDWHQDDMYFSTGIKDAVVTAWLPLDDVDTENGCMTFVPCANTRLFEHRKIEADTRQGFYFAIEDTLFDPSETVPIVIKRGQCLFHHGLAPHRSMPNISSRMRRAFAMHFCDAGLSNLRDIYTKLPEEMMPVVRRAA